MKLTAIFLFVTCLEVSARSNAQAVTISLRNASLERVFKEVKKQTGYSFVYTRELIQQTGSVTVDIKNASLQQVLDQVLAGQPLTYSIQDRFIIIKPKTTAPPPKLIDTARPGENVSKIKLQGRVVEVTGEPLAGASIILRQPGKTIFVAGTTDANGGFRIINIADGTYILEVTFIGYEKVTREIKLTDKPQVLWLPMKKATDALDAIQTMAYSKTTMRFNTGDITTVTSEEIARNPVPNVLQSLQGRVPGMLITETSGKPNSSFQVQVRSLNTLSGGVSNAPIVLANGGQPLYIVDGVEYPANGFLPMANFYGYPNAEIYGNALNYVDPSLIESVNILKGADATSIYGSRGAFGVFLITTKKAKAGKPSVTINAVQGFSTLGVSPKLLNLQDYLALRHNAFANDGKQPQSYDYDVNGTWDTTKSTDWKKFFMGGHAPTTRINATYSGGSANSSFLLGANYSSIGNIERAKGSVRQGGMNFSLNTATNDRKITMALSGSYSTNLDNTVPVDFSGPYGLTQAPNAPSPYLPNGKLNWQNGTNPAAALNGLYNNQTDNFLANTSLTYSPLPGLSFTAAGGFSLLSAKEFQGQPSSMFNPATFTPSQTHSVLNFYRYRTLSADPRAEFLHTWGKARLDVIAGVSLKDQLQTQTAVVGSNFASDELLLDPTSAPSANGYSVYRVKPQKYIGAFTVINFRWADKYILALNGRRDGSSVFGANHQFGNFGSVAGAWILSEEPWFKGLRKVVDFFKLKASYGLVGGSALQPYQYISTYGYGNNAYEGGLGLFPQNLANADLHWETNRNFEAGVNIDLFKGRINIDATYYSDNVGDQITSQGLASITGFSSYFTNTSATIRSYGAEFAVTGKIIQNQNFSWTTKINATIPRTKLLSFPGLGTLVNNYNFIIGKPITGLRVVKFAGVDPATGVYNFYNAAGVKGEYTFLSPTPLSFSDRTAFIDRAPKWYGGILNSFSYKNFSLDFLVSVTKRTGPSYEAYQSFGLGAYNTNVPADIANERWMKPGDVAKVAKASNSINAFIDQNNFINSTGAYSDATYARLQNLSLGYRLPVRVVQKMHLTLLQVYVAGQNLLTVSKYKGLDPENMTSSHMPPLRVYTGGINVGF
ncbi:SusC/RagA family TonB-linked outer membrane protein [Puia dinghuensis]|uniref:SusC/RagA family TonB-linked outer membrane protein n=1 Tax=Puia dinghuensis TaxID=1792502 RepID=A0A8J2UDG8_9BACT|nr:SusC/RagA family TonB-linked outer membrane protein [Puia dinghuensis]GGB02480.1 SusC/RagA family TonB-linked outer membrane protein [Puia dinghuensis]